MITFPVV
ncbi:rCG45861, isoform CRA_b [Rattus norvegicus]|nr:rCG45861, isoform CRA_b [Rattus norvegicus]